MASSESVLQAKVQVTFPPAAGQTSPRGYDVRIGTGLLDDLGTALAESCPAHRYAIITDSNVAPLYGEKALEQARAASGSAELFEFPAGEGSKNREWWAELSDRMLSSGYGRDAAVVALGGGVTGDLAGFVAATYLRGLPLVQVPTSLLAMIDSSVGGKTGVDTPAGKNLIGAFLQPELVVADTATLRTLPRPEVRAGMAEAVKHGAIADADYFDWIESSAGSVLGLAPEAVVRMVRRSVEIKAAVVGADERESGLRKTLNFGHTVGHAVEALSGFRLLHGEAVAIGMVVEAMIGERLGVSAEGTADRLRAALSALGLPVRVPGDQDPRRVLELTRVDKKARAGQVEYALIERVGTASRGGGHFGCPVDDALVLEEVERARGETSSGIRDP
jgi:3-dehydroquinate synthase